MNYFNKTMAAAIIAGAMSLTSCVDNEVAPEVKQMRAAQVAYIQASADLKAAEARSEQIRNDYDEANYAIMLESNQATLDAKLAAVEVSLLQAQVSLKEAELDLAEAVADMEEYIAKHGLEVAADYLEEYTAAHASLQGAVGAQLVLKAQLAKEQLILASGNSSWEITKERLERELAKEVGKLEAQKAALETLEGVAADPATANAEIDALVVANAELDNANAELTVDQKKALNAKTAAKADRDAALEAIEEYEDIQGDIDDQNEDIEDKELAIEAQVETVETATTDLAEADEELKRREDRLEKYEAALVPKVAAVEAAQADDDKAEEARLDALVTYKVDYNDFKVAIQDYYVPPTEFDVSTISAWHIQPLEGNPWVQYAAAKYYYDAAEDDRDDAKGDYDDAKDHWDNTADKTDQNEIQAWDDAQAAWTDAQEVWATWTAAFSAEGAYEDDYEAYKVFVDAKAVTAADLSQAEADMAAYQNDVDDATTAVDNATTALDNATTALEEAQDDLAELENDLVVLQEGDVFAEPVVKGLVQLEAELAAAQTAYDDAIANMAELTAEYDATSAAHAAIGVEITNNNSMITENNGVITVLNSYLSNINEAISDKQDDIEDTREAILDLEKSIADEGVSEADQEEKIAVLEAKIAEKEAEIEAYQALVDKWKALLDAALAGN